MQCTLQIGCRCTQFTKACLIWILINLLKWLNFRTDKTSLDSASVFSNMFLLLTWTMTPNAVTRSSSSIWTTKRTPCLRRSTFNLPSGDLLVLSSTYLKPLFMVMSPYSSKMTWWTVNTKQKSEETISHYVYRLREQATIAYSSENEAEKQCLLTFLRGIHVPRILFGKLDSEIAVGPSGPISGPTFGGVFEVPDPYAPA